MNTDTSPDETAGKVVAHTMVLAYLVGQQPTATAALGALASAIDDLSLFSTMSERQRAALRAELQEVVRRAQAFARP